MKIFLIQFVVMCSIVISASASEKLIDAETINPDINYDDYPLHRAILSMDATEIGKLLDGKADINRAHDKTGITPLHLAIAMMQNDPFSAPKRYNEQERSKAERIVTLLLDEGADPNIRNFFGEYPVYMVLPQVDYTDDSHETKISRATERLALLKRKGASFNQRMLYRGELSSGISSFSLPHSALLGVCLPADVEVEPEIYKSFFALFADSDYVADGQDASSYAIVSASLEGMNPPCYKAFAASVNTAIQ